MSRSLQIVCDGCGKPKQQANHWWSVALSARASDGATCILIESFAQNTLQGARDFCGQDCVLKFVSEWMCSNWMGKARGETTNDAK